MVERREGRTMTADALLFFNDRPQALPIYAALDEALAARFGPQTPRVQKTQITYGNPKVFACVSLPEKGGGGRPCLPGPGPEGSLSPGGRRRGALSRPVDQPHPRPDSGGGRRPAAELDGGSLPLCPDKGKIKNRGRPGKDGPGFFSQ